MDGKQQGSGERQGGSGRPRSRCFGHQKSDMLQTRNGDDLFAPELLRDRDLLRELVQLFITHADVLHLVDDNFSAPELHLIDNTKAPLADRLLTEEDIRVMQPHRRGLCALASNCNPLIWFLIQGFLEGLRNKHSWIRKTANANEMPLQKGLSTEMASLL